jgi:putative ATP-binding cassette transporter
MDLIRFLGRQSRILLVLAILTNLLAGVSFAAVAAIIERGVREPNHWVTLGLALISACLVDFAMRMASARSMLELSQSALFRLRLELCSRILVTPYATLQRLGKHRLLAILTHDSERLMNACQAIIGLLRAVIIILVCLLYLARTSWILTSIFAGLLVAGMTLTRVLTQIPEKTMALLREHIDEFYRHLRDLIEGSRELQLNSRRAYRFINNTILPQAAVSRSQTIQGMLSFEAVIGFGQLLYCGSIGILLFILPRWIHFAPGTLAGALIIVLFVNTNISEALHLLPAVSIARASLRKLEQLAEQLPISSGLAQLVGPPAQYFHLELDGIRHSYTEDQNRSFTLGPIDMTVKSGEILFVVGGNGSGKSTLGLLILGLYRARSGEIRLNGEVLSEQNQNRYRQNFSAVLADFHLFEDVFDVDDPRLQQRATNYLRDLSIDHEVRIQGGKFSTTQLSSGQRKRLALVSAYLEDRPCYLFDEWAADQDPEFKRIFYTTLLPELKALGKAVIVITHDDAYFDCADRVIKLVDGSVLKEVVKSPDVSDWDSE